MTKTIYKKKSFPQCHSTWKVASNQPSKFEEKVLENVDKGQSLSDIKGVVWWCDEAE